MQSVPTPPDEAARLELLRSLDVLDTPPDPVLDSLVQCASQLTGCPVSLVSVVDAERQWFKARTGTEACETARDISICGHAIMGKEVFVVEDAARDRRFADNPLVTGDPFIRFYAGAPLILPDGMAVGTLCVIDTEPRIFSRIDQAILSALRDVAVEELLRQARES